MPEAKKVDADKIEAAPASMTVGAADDVAEHDADRRADAALGWLAAQRPMDHPAPEEHVHTAACGIARSHAPASGATIGAEGGAVDADTQREIEQAVGGGSPLAASVRSPMEQAFGSNLGRVRVHHGEQADRLSRSMSAEAFTTGQDIFFRKGAYDPDSSRGQRVLAHELGHVVQNRRDVRRLVTQPADLDPLATRGPMALRSTFTKIRNALTAAQKATTPEAKAKALQNLNDLCTTWLNDHSGSQDPKDQQRRELVLQLADEVPAELARTTQNQAQGIYLENATGQSAGKNAKHNLKAISQDARAAAKNISKPAQDVQDGDSPTIKARKEKRKAATAAGLSDAEFSAITTFTAQDYKYINPATANSAGWLKAQKDGAEQAEKEQMFDGRDDKTLFEEGSLHTGVATQGLLRMPAYTQPVYRGSCMSDKEFADLQTANGWSCASMASSSKSRLVADGFADSSGDKQPEKKLRVIMEIEDSGGRDVEAFSKYPNEKEVMLLAGSSYVAVSITTVEPPKPFAKKAKDQGHTWYLVKLKPKGKPPAPSPSTGGTPSQPQ